MKKIIGFLLLFHSVLLCGESLKETAHALFLNQRYQEAIQYYTEALKQNPKLAEGYLYRGISYHELGLFKEALSDYQKTLELEKNNLEALLYRGILYQATGEYQKSEADLSRVIETKPTHAEAYFYLGKTHFFLEKFDLAVKSYSKAIFLNPRAEIYFYRGIAYTSSKDYEKALKDYFTVLEIDENYFFAYYNLACVYSLKKEQEKACFFFRQAVKTGVLEWNEIEKDTDLENFRESFCYQQVMKQYKGK